MWVLEVFTSARVAIIIGITATAITTPTIDTTVEIAEWSSTVERTASERKSASAGASVTDCGHSLYDIVGVATCVDASYLIGRARTGGGHVGERFALCALP
jgi:hypothetical protein